MPLKISIITGVQKGADRAALDWAIKNSMPHGGWCPLGRVASDGPLDAQYKLKETATEAILESVEGNVRDSDATVVFTLGPKATGPAQKAGTLAKKTKKPYLHLHRAILGVSERLTEFMDKYYTRRLHITGSTEADEAGISDWVTGTLDKMKGNFDRRPE